VVSPNIAAGTLPYTPVLVDAPVPLKFRELEKLLAIGSDIRRIVSVADAVAVIETLPITVTMSPTRM
jgi:hypothetical protein